MVAGRSGSLLPLVAACRLRQWPKNLLVFAAPLFAFRFQADIWLAAGAALVAFCLISSAIYLRGASWVIKTLHGTPLFNPPPERVRIMCRRCS